MDFLYSNSKRVRNMLIVFPLILVLILVSYVVYIHHFNAEERTTVGNDETSDVYMDIGVRNDSTAKWIKRDYDLYGQTVDLNAETIDGTIYNNSPYQLSDWEMRFNVGSECFLNNAWNGAMEIHQDVKTDEDVQLLKLSDYMLEDIHLDYLYQGDLLIALHDGDYFIYEPSKETREMPIDKDVDITIGFIMYYLDEPDLTDYQITYHYNRKITDGQLFYWVLCLAAIWLVILLMYLSMVAAYRKAVHDNEVKKKGMLSMSDIYSIIYIIDTKKNKLTPLVADNESERQRPKDMTASDQLRNMCKFDCADAYRELAMDFCDLSTLPERMSDKNTIVLEYKSNTYGWCQFRFFVMDRELGAAPEKFIFTIRVINEEKAELEAVSKRVEEAEMESRAKSTFLANMSHEIRTPINTVIGLDTMILRESKEPAIKTYARDIKSAANMLLSLINSILDFSKLEADKMELVPVDYSLRHMIQDVRNMVKARAEFNSDKLTLEFNVDESLPNQLYGDDVRLKQVMINLLTNAAKYTDEGTVTVTIKGERTEDKVHMLFSVKDTGMGIRQEDLSTLTERFSRFDEKKRNRNVEGTGIGLNLVTGILELMDSELQVDSVYGEGSDFYFEVDQEVHGDELLGSLEIAADDQDEEEDEEYSVLFTAPDARILVVDDNAMNLNVFVNLLKETKLQIDTAKSGAESLEMTEKDQYDLIFMDHMMPEMDGIEAFKRIRSQEDGKNRETPVVVLTANAIKGVEEEYRAVGFTDYLAKPIQPDALEKMIAEYVDPSKLNMHPEAEHTEEKTIELPVITGMDTAYGLSHTGGLDSYIAVMKQFADMAEPELEELLGYYEAIVDNNEDHEAIKSYRIKVHSMKSSANVIGGIQLSGVAAMLERAAQNEDVSRILDVTGYLADDWRVFSGDVAEYIHDSFPEEGTAGTGEAMDPELAEELLHQLDVSMNSYDVDNADQLMERLGGAGWDQQQAVIIKKLKTAVTNLDADETTRLCDELIQML